MNKQHEPTLEKQTSEPILRTINYPELVDFVQLGVARELDLPGAIPLPTVDKEGNVIKQKGPTSFAELLNPLDEETRKKMICEVGRRFDDALINFISAAIIRHQERGVVILAEEDEGIGGYLPWEEALQKKIHLLKESGVLDASASVNVERYRSAEKDQVEDSYRKLGATALLVA